MRLGVALHNTLGVHSGIVIKGPTLSELLKRGPRLATNAAPVS